MDYATVKEGGTRLVVPRASLSEVPPTSPVFFNPRASTNRDVSVSLVESTDGVTFCDTMTGVGARGVRVANEVRRKMAVTMVDIRLESISLAKRNARLNRVARGCKFVSQEANAFLHSVGRGRFDYVDLDPFGTPAPYLPGLMRSVASGGIASVTATDTAVLCGVHKQVALRRYGAMPLNNEFGHETAARILLDACRRQAGILDLGIVPVAAHSTRHYVRVFFRVLSGASEADRSLREEGFVVVCRTCGERRTSKVPQQTCESCGGKASSAGPMWVGGLAERKTVKKAIAVARSRGFGEAERIFSSLLNGDALPPWSFDLSRICSSLKVASVPGESVASTLVRLGYKCEEQEFERGNLKTDAPYREVSRVVAEIARRK